MTGLVTLLGYLCFAGAAAAIVVYLWHFIRREGWRRPWNAAGLFFTSIALSFTPFLFSNMIDRGTVRAAVVVTLCLLAATGLQAFTAMRQRRRRDDRGPDDRAGDTGSGPAA